MHPRILLRTHYQADEPRIIIATVTHCTTPTGSRSEDAVAEAVVRWARAHGITISFPGAVYAVGNARALSLLNSSNRWTSAGLAFGYLDKSGFGDRDDNRVALTGPEERLYLKQYVSGAGALVITFGRWLVARGATTDEELRSESVIERQVVEILDEYLAVATDFRDRAAIRRERDRLRGSDYAASTKRHKRYPLLTTMERLRLLDVTKSNGDRISMAPDRMGRLSALAAGIPDVAKLEKVARDSSLPSVLDSLLQDRGGQDLLTGSPATVLTEAYSYAMSLGVQACSLEYLDDVLYAFFPLDGKPQVQCGELLDGLRAKMPRDVRFHVDRRGRRAFVILSEAALQRLTRGDGRCDGP